MLDFCGQSGPLNEDEAGISDEARLCGCFVKGLGGSFCDAFLVGDDNRQLWTFRARRDRQILDEQHGGVQPIR